MQIYFKYKIKPVKTKKAINEYYYKEFYLKVKWKTDKMRKPIGWIINLDMANPKDNTIIHDYLSNPNELENTLMTMIKEEVVAMESKNYLIKTDCRKLKLLQWRHLFYKKFNINNDKLLQQIQVYKERNNLK